MKLRIISGSLKGRFVTIPERAGTFRPTRERIRGSVADILSPYIPGATVADVCAGSGAFGFEMASRGACQVFLVENDCHRGKLIAQHAERFGIARMCHCVIQDVKWFIRNCRNQFDIMYFDPPYDVLQLSDMIGDLLSLLSESGILVHELRNTKKTGAVDAAVKDDRLFSRRFYGETEIRLFRRKTIAPSIE